MTRFTAAADWLQNITGTPPDVAEVDRSQSALLLRDAYNMSNLEVRDRASRHARLPTSRVRGGPLTKTRNLHQPKPKFVAHKTPKNQHTKSEKKSDRLGGKLHYA